MENSVIRRYEADILNCLRELVSIPSAAVETGDENLPFGENAGLALSYILNRAEKLGFSVRNINNACGYAEYNPNGIPAADDHAAVLTHVDVVPAGDGWNTDPFKLTEIDGVLYGRGIADDKGAAVVALYCMKALADEDFVGKRPIRCIFGCGEEIGMDDMAIYFANEPLPTTAFTPDSGYPVCNREKGILHLTASLPYSGAVSAFDAGAAINCVAAKAHAEFSAQGGINAVKSVIDGIYESDFAQCDSARLERVGDSLVGDSYRIEVEGRSAHAMQPHLGKNAACTAVRMLRAILPDDRALAVIEKLFCRGTDGAELGVAQSDEPSGALTMNLGWLRLEDGRFKAGIDIRYPVTQKNSDALVGKIKETFALNGVTLDSVFDNEPIYMPEDDPLIQRLSACYEQVTGKTGGVYSTGGGTYARALKGRGVAFGMEFPDSPPTRLHEANECFGREDLMRHAEICLAAMRGMMEL